MCFMKREFIRTKCWQNITENFIRDCFDRFHYSKEQYELFKNEALALKLAIKDSEAAELCFYDGHIDVAFTLGSFLDTLIEKENRANHIMEALMLTNIASALLMEGYRQFEDIALKYFKVDYVEYIFWGDSRLPACEIENAMAEFDKISISVNDAMNLIPSQSVLFRLIPSGEGKSICDACELKKEGRCIECR